MKETLDSQLILITALHMLPGLRAADVEAERQYQEACAEAAAEKHRPEYCRHGTYMWVDHDCACARCENGDDPTVYERALMISREMWTEFDRRRQIVTAAWQAGLVASAPFEEIGGLPESVKHAMETWQQEPVDEWRRSRQFYDDFLCAETLLRMRHLERAIPRIHDWQTAHRRISEWVRLYDGLPTSMQMTQPDPPAMSDAAADYAMSMIVAALEATTLEGDN